MNEPPAMQLGDLLAAARKKKDWSARQLSSKAALSPSYVSKVESGEIEPSLRAFALLARELQLTQAEICFCVTTSGSADRT